MTSADFKDRLRMKVEAVLGDATLDPPPHLRFVGDGDFRTIAAEYLAYFVEIGGLTPYDVVLELGSGIGRMASGIAAYLDPQFGQYIGIDPVLAGVTWSQQTLQVRYPHASFQHVDLQNDLYNPAGLIQAADWIFPLPANSVNLCIATSVFTHMREAEIAHYLREVRRVLSPTGRLFATAYMIGEGDAGVAEGRAPHIQFNERAPNNPDRWHVSGQPALAAVAFDESYFAALVGDILGERAAIRPGRWRGGAGPWFQDAITL